MDTMKDIITKNEFLKLPKIDDVVEGIVLGKEKGAMFFDLGSQGAGIIYGREFYGAKENLKGLKVGDKIPVKIIGVENDDGYIELSVTRAGEELAWETLQQNKKDNATLVIKILGANKGGLLTKVMGIPAFIPTSQLAPEHYPKVEGADTQKILGSLQKLIGEETKVKIFDLEPKEGKLILSEKAMETEKIKDIIKNLKVGDIIEGEITGIVDFGAFMKFAVNNDNDMTPDKDKSAKQLKTTQEGADQPTINYLEGLIHISELDWQLIEDPSEIVKVGQKVKAKIIDISNDRISLSLKALKKDPWDEIEEKYKKGNTVKGEVTRINPFGAFIQIEPKIQGLCHISEFASQENLEKSLKIGSQYDFQILSIEPKEHKMSLKLMPKEKTE